MRKLPLFRVLCALSVLGVAVEVTAEPVLCIAQDPLDGRLDGAILSRADVCNEGELELGRVVDPEGGRIDFKGVEVQLPGGRFFGEVEPVDEPVE